MDVLFIKTSSLGDVIHHMPAVTEARARRPGRRFAWVVEEAFAPLVRLHPAVDDVIPVAARRWRRAAAGGRRRGARSRLSGAALRARTYDEVIDTQGLFFKSALIARARAGGGMATTRKASRSGWRLMALRRAPSGRDGTSMRSRATATLTGLALGYAPRGRAGLRARSRAHRGAKPAAPYGVLLHATARAGQGMAGGELAKARGGARRRHFDLVLPWGTRGRARRGRSASPQASRARACRSGSRSMRWRG